MSDIPKIPKSSLPQRVGVLRNDPCLNVRRMSDISERAEQSSRRNVNLVAARESAQEEAREDKLGLAQLQALLASKHFTQTLFNLFDERAENCLVQEGWFDQLKQWTEVSFCGRV